MLICFLFRQSVYLGDVLHVYGYICSLSCCAKEVNVNVCQFVVFLTELYLIFFRPVLVVI